MTTKAGMKYDGEIKTIFDVTRQLMAQPVRGGQDSIEIRKAER